MLPNETPNVPASPPPSASSSAPTPQSGSGCLSSVGWLASAPVLACFSPSFYAHAVRRRTGSAFLLFFVFTFVISSLQTCGIAWGLLRAGQDIRNAFERGEFPEITISNGVAEVKGQQPFVFDDEDTFFGIDTTGQYTEIDRRRYSQGLLLKRTSIVFLNRQGEYQEVPLRDVQTLLNLDDPFILDGETATGYWTGFSVIFAVIAFVFLLIWNWIVRVAYLALIALLLWGLMVLLKPGTGFGPVVSVGLYALVPALFVVHLLSQLSLRFPGLTTVFLLIFWGLGLAEALFAPRKPYSAASFGDYMSSDRPLRAWRALIALPLVLDVMLELIFGWQAAVVTWPLTFITFGALLIASFWPMLMPSSAPAQNQ